MSFVIDRRALLTTAALGIGGLVLPGGSLAAQMLTGATGFTHNVASGEPGSDSMLLWTRYVSASGAPSKVRAEISESRDFAKVVSGGQMITGPWRDHTVKITVDGLNPGTTYYYRFIGPDGAISPIGRTKTLPVGKAGKFNIAIFSCANLGFGFFNAYGHAAARSDIDLVLHTGDYLYEYSRGGYDNGSELAKRIFPETEMLNLADYRLRYVSYRADPDLQALHAAFPVIPNTDDHEGANDAWEGSAQNHQPDEGDWTNRKNAAMQVWREWMPVGEQPWKSYEIGDLATFFRTDTRMIARSRPHDYGTILRSGDANAALAAFRDGAWQDPAATMMGTEQESWLAHAFRAAAREKKVWHLLGVGTNIGYNSTPPDALDWLDPGAADRAKGYFRAGIAAGKAGLPYNLDNWGGYPQAKSRLLSAAQSVDANLVAVTGDSHNGWAFDLIEGGRAAGVEFGGHSVTSPGIESATRSQDQAKIAKALIANSKELRWADTSNRGYMLLSLTPQAATNEWVFVDTVKTRNLTAKVGNRMKVRPGKKVLESA
jgi:alkaline phosphatase D